MEKSVRGPMLNYANTVHLKQIFYDGMSGFEKSVTDDDFISGQMLPLNHLHLHEFSNI